MSPPLARVDVSAFRVFLGDIWEISRKVGSLEEEGGERLLLPKPVEDVWRARVDERAVEEVGRVLGE